MTFSGEHPSLRAGHAFWAGQWGACLGVGGSMELEGYGTCDVCVGERCRLSGGKTCSFLLGQQPEPSTAMLPSRADRKKGAGASCQGCPESRGFSTCTLSPHGNSPKKADKMEEGHGDTPDILPTCHSLCHQIVRPVLRIARKGHLGASVQARLLLWISFLCLWIKHRPSLGISVSPTPRPDWLVKRSLSSWIPVLLLYACSPSR